MKLVEINSLERRDRNNRAEALKLQQGLIELGWENVRIETRERVGTTPLEFTVTADRAMFIKPGSKKLKLEIDGYDDSEFFWEDLEDPGRSCSTEQMLEQVKRLYGTAP